MAREWGVLLIFGHSTFLRPCSIPAIQGINWAWLNSLLYSNLQSLVIYQNIVALDSLLKHLDIIYNHIYNTTYCDNLVSSSLDKVSYLIFIRALVFESFAPPDQILTTTIHLYKLSRDTYQPLLLVMGLRSSFILREINGPTDNCPETPLNQLTTIFIKILNITIKHVCINKVMIQYCKCRTFLNLIDFLKANHSFYSLYEPIIVYYVVKHTWLGNHQEFYKLTTLLEIRKFVSKQVGYFLSRRIAVGDQLLWAGLYHTFAYKIRMSHIKLEDRAPREIFSETI